MFFVLALIYAALCVIDQVILLVAAALIFHQPPPQERYIRISIVIGIMVIAFFQLLAIIRFYDRLVERLSNNSSASDKNENT